MEFTDRLMEYLRGDRRGKKANRLEREALSDPFMFEALEGLTAVDDSAKGLDNLTVRLHKRVNGGWHMAWKAWVIAAAVCVIGGMIWWVIPHQEIQPQLARSVAFMHEEESRDSTHAAVVSYNALESRSVADRAEVLTDSSETEAEKETMTLVPVLKKAKVLADTSEDSDMLVKIENSVEGGPMPVGGIEVLNRFVRNSLVYPEDALKAGLQGDIRLSFIVNQNGRPSRIRVIEWITHSCNREAIRLLDEGPVWTYTGSEELTYVTISFRLPEKEKTN